MSKKIFTMLSLALMLSLIPKFSFTVDAATTCSTKQECNDIISEAQSQISDLKSKEAAVQKEIDINDAEIVKGPFAKWDTKVDDLIEQLNDELNGTSMYR